MPGISLLIANPVSVLAIRLRAIFLLIVSLGLAGHLLLGAWTDKSAGLPLLGHFSAKDLGSSETRWIVLEDKYGRLFVAGDGLQVFDGQSWRSFPVGLSYQLMALAFGDDGRMWAGAINEVGYFAEESLGGFKYHSLISHLPKNQQLIGEVWGCAQVGRIAYFVCRDKVLRWDGTSFKILPFAGQSRLFPINMAGEFWFHHLETGLHRLSEEGPHLEIPAAALPGTGILGLAKDEEGFLVASGLGLYRPGSPPRRISDDRLSRHITDNRLTSFAPLPGGNYAFGTISGGMAISDGTGVPLRIFDTSDGLPSRYLFSFRTDLNDHLWCVSPEGITNIEDTGRASVFNKLNGLKGRILRLVKLPDSTLLAITQEGVFRLIETESDGGQFQQLPEFTATYFHLLPIAGGSLLSRHGGVDFFDGSTVRSVFSLTGGGVYFALPSRADSKTFYILESNGLGRLTRQSDGSFSHTLLTKLPDYGHTMLEDSAGRLWIGTLSKGAFVYDPASQQLSPISNPATGEPLPGPISIIDRAQGILLFGNGCVLETRPDGSGLAALRGAPDINPLTVIPLPGEQDVLVAFTRVTPTDNAAQGLGVLTITASREVQWRELDVLGLHTTGLINTMKFTRENGRDILWISGGEGILRLDYDTLRPVQNPSPPFLQLDLQNAGQVPDASGMAFSFRPHRLSFHVFTGEHTRTKDWLLQSRLGNKGTGEWSAPSARRSFEFSNLSEGDYRFEVRTVNGAGLTSEPAVFAFRILPPWYRSTWALLAYAGAIGVGVIVVIRVRERRIRARNEELEALVKVRTAELVKANAAKDEFLAGISHEIRNPMNGVIGIADNFRTESLDPDSRRKFGLLRQCATHLSSLLEDILDFSKVQAGAVEIEAKPFNLSELMDSIAAMTAADSEKRGIPVEIAVSPAVPDHLIGDPKRVRQILLNFVSNALKFSGRGQVSVTVWCKNLHPGSAEVIFAVSDEGPGISPEEQQRLFTRFERGAAAQQGRVPGTGLGLALCKGLAEKMGGRIWLESEPGQGSCFSFSAPFAIVDAETDQTPVAAPAAAIRPKVALVVDDQEYNRIVLTDQLETLGFVVQSAGDGTTALALAGSQDFDAVFLDLNLPGLSGLEVSRAIRALPNKSATAVILATTAFSTPEKRNQCVAAGMDAFVGKPVTLERLRKALASAMPAGPASVPAEAAPRPATDGLANLRLLATKKNVPFAEELALYLSEFEVEFDQLQAAVRKEDSSDATHCAHQLYGRCAFIAERPLEQALRAVEADAATGHWEEVRRQLSPLSAQVADLRARLTSSVPIAPPA